MNTSPHHTKKISRRALVKVLMLLGLICAGLCLMHFTPVKDFLTPECLARFLDRAGIWGPIAFIVIHGTSISLFVPASLMVVAGGVIFGTFWGFIYVLLGCLLGATVAFYIGRTLGRDFAASLLGDRLKKYDAAIERNGFTAV